MAAIMLPNRVARHLAQRGLDPLGRPDFALNDFSRMLEISQQTKSDDPQSCFAVLSAVPAAFPSEAYEDFHSVAAALRRDLQILQDPAGRWLPEKHRFSSQGLVLYDEDYSRSPRNWEAYCLIGRDGSLEFVRSPGVLAEGRAYIRFVPVIAWIQRVCGLLTQLRSQMAIPCEHWLILSLCNLRGSRLCNFGVGWLEPFDFRGENQPTAIEDQVALPSRLATIRNLRSSGNGLLNALTTRLEFPMSSHGAMTGCSQKMAK